LKKVVILHSVLKSKKKQIKY
jgi:hypothetical protein